MYIPDSESGYLLGKLLNIVIPFSTLFSSLDIQSGSGFPGTTDPGLVDRDSDCVYTF